MALDYVFYEDRNLVLLIGSGRLTAKDITDFLNNCLCKDPRIKSGYIELGDFRAVEVNEVTIAEIREFVQLDSILNRPHPSKIAFVVPDDAGYGSVRQYAAFAELENKEIVPFRSMDEAKAWLGMSDYQID